MGIFGMSKKESWQLLCQEIGARYIEGGFWKNDWVEYNVGHWTIVLETYVVSTGKVVVTYTRVRVPYAVYYDFCFKIYSNGIFSGLEKLLNTQNIKTGDESFDEMFMVKSADDEMVLRLLGDPMLRSLLFEQHHINLDAHNGKSFWENSLPEGVNELVFRENGIITDMPRLIGLLQLFARFLVVMMDLDIVRPESVAEGLRKR